MIRGQLCLYGTTTDDSGWMVAGGVGIVEAPTGMLKAERILPFVGTCFGDAHLLACSRYSERPVGDCGHELSDHVRDTQWPRPAAGSGVPGGGIMFRHTRVPAVPGCEILSLAICMYVPGDTVASQKMYSLSGVLDQSGIPVQMSVHSPTYCAPLAENGMGMTALLKRPVWGWSGDPFALQSTMRLDIIDEAMETARLLDAEARTPEDEAGLSKLRGRPGYDVAAFSRQGSDASRFAKFRRLVGVVEPHDDWSKPVNAEQQRAFERRAEEAVRTILEDAA